ncbi:MAG: hypothetical protein RLY14_3245, partial [Planctomycetota bacterium]|jgi:hypothetical protein
LTKALDADYIYNVPAAGGRQGGPIFIGSETDRLEPVVPKLP